MMHDEWPVTRATATAVERGDHLTPGGDARTAMPSRWWVPIQGIDPTRVVLEQVHGAVSAWFDHSDAEHRTDTKPYSVSPLSAEHADRGDDLGLPPSLGIEIGVLTLEAHGRLMAATTQDMPIRLGSQFGSVGRPHPIQWDDWATLAEPTGVSEWELEFVTPTTFRTRDRSSPLPTPSTVLRRPAEVWSLWSGMPPRRLPRECAEAVWVSDIDGRSHALTLGRLRVSGFVGRLTLRCDEPEIATLIDPLLRLAAYSGVGSGTTKGLGVTRVATIARPLKRSTTKNHGKHQVPSTPPPRAAHLPQSTGHGTPR
jgi:CRISPR-associated endoribonuclease Cas6